MVSRSTHDDAALIAAEAGRALLALRCHLESDRVDVQALRVAADRRSHELIVRALAERYPDDPVLSEEAADDPARLGSPRVWIIDPLDGTREFGEIGRSDWAVHVALVVDGVPAAAAVALPARALTLSTVPPARLPLQAGHPLRIAVSRTRPPAIARDLATRLRADLVEMGSAGVKAMAVVLGEADIYVHAGGQYEWDSAAPAAVAAAAGLHVSRIDGTALRYNRADPWLPDLLICRQELSATVLDILAAVSQT